MAFWKWIQKLCNTEICEFVNWPAVDDNKKGLEEVKSLTLYEIHANIWTESRSNKVDLLFILAFFVHTDRPSVETIVRKRLFVPLDWVKSNKHVWHYYYLLHFYSHWTIMAQSYSEWYDVERRSIWPFYFGLGKTWCLLL